MAPLPNLDFEHGIVLVTGATGFIGRALIRKLIKQRNIQALALARRPTTVPLDAEDAGKLRFVSCDLTDAEAVSQLATALGEVNFVIHLAAQTPKSRLEANDPNLLQSNVVSTLNLVRYLSSTKLKCFVYASSLDVYGRLAQIPASESCPTFPETLYGATKLMAEKCLDIYGGFSGVPVVVLRYSHVYGPGEDAYNKVIPVFIRTVLNGRFPEIWGDGSSTRDFVYVDDVVQATLLALRERESGTYNIASGQETSIREVAEIIVELAGQADRLTPIFRDVAVQRSRIVFDISAACNRLSYTPQVDLREGLSREIAWFHAWGLEN